MGYQPFSAVLRYLQRAAGLPAVDEASDGQLLERFVNEQDPVAFEMLMQRHGRLVWGVCQRLLPDKNDAEDAFQAAFLVLIRKAGSLGKPESLGSWLYGVAYRVAFNLLREKAKQARRQGGKGQVEDMPQPEAATDSAWRELRPVLDAELNRLPDKYRAPLILCYLEGKTNEQAAQELGWPIGSISKRLSRGRELLRDRLTSRGVWLSAAALALLLAEKSAAAAAPVAVLEQTLTVAQVLLHNGNTTVAGLTSPQVAALTEGVIRTMFLNKLTSLALVLTLFAAAAGSALTAQQLLVPTVLAPASAQVSAEQPAAALTAEEFARLQQIISPGAEDSRWLQVPWMSSHNIYAARKKAAEEGKPLLLWYMAGEPLGAC